MPKPNLDKGEHEQLAMLAPSTSTLQTTFSDPATTSSAFNTIVPESSLPESRQHHQQMPQMNFNNFQQQQHFNNPINFITTTGMTSNSQDQQHESISAGISGNYLNSNPANPNNSLVLQQ